jgi:hypothetical protein
MSATRTPHHLTPVSLAPNDREGVLSDAVFAAIRALQRLLISDDPHLTLKAAEMILDLEKTRLRHGRPVSGTDLSAAPIPPAPTPEPVELPDGGVNWANPLEVYIEQVRQLLQAEADEAGTGAVVTRDAAEAFVRRIIHAEELASLEAHATGPPAARGMKSPASVSCVDSS